VFLDPPQPKPPRLEALQDVRIQTAPGLEDRTRCFYAEALGFIEEPAGDAGSGEWYFAGQKHRIVVETVEAAPARQLRRRALLEVRSLKRVEEHFKERGVRYVKESGLSITGRRLFVSDPAGNRLELRQTWPL